MTATQLLAQYGVTLQQARDFVNANLNSPGVVFSTCKQYGITTSMLGEIAGGYTSAQVTAFFSSHGINASALDPSTSTATSQFVPSNLSGLTSLLSLDTYSGALSLASLRAQVVAATNSTDYNRTFSPTNYPGSEDGTFSAADLGVSHLGSLPATTETMESLFFGTMIKALKAIDIQEVTELQNFLTSNLSGIQSGNTAVLSQYTNLLVGIFQDQAAFQVIPDATIATVAVQAGVAMVQLVGQGSSPALLDGLFHFV